MGVAPYDGEAAHRLRKWERDCREPGGRSAAAMRALLGLTPSQAASRAGVALQDLRDFEAGSLALQFWHGMSNRLDAAYRAQGARWCEPDLHDGACCVYLERSLADDRRAILAALALMGRTVGKRPRKVTVQLLAKRVEERSRIPARDVRRALQGRCALSPKMVAACFRQLGDGDEGAGCYFIAGPLSGWRQVGCAPEGACW